MGGGVTMWQPIETAPKGYDQFVLLCNERGYVTVGSWDGYWQDYLDGQYPDGTFLSVEPTRWMPLPDAP